MGYRSKVILGVKQGKLSNEFDEILKRHDFRPNKSNDYLKINDTHGYKTYLFDDIKWYESDEWCKELTDWLYETQLHNLDDCWAVGMGEDGDLHVDLGHWYDYVNLIRDINLINEHHGK